MQRLFRLQVLICVVIALAVSASVAAPIVTLKSFNSATFEYTYEVMLAEGDSLSALSIVTDGLVEPNESPYWTYTSAPAGWTGSTSYGPPDAGQWAGPLLETPGTYEFTWIVLNSRPGALPTASAAYTWSGTQSFLTQSVVAPTAVPEPGSIVALSLFAAAIGPFIRRRTG